VVLGSLGILVNVALIAIPGYWSHDEIQFGTYASRESLDQIPWASVLDVGHFHYRPLTFNVWMLSSYYLFHVPPAMHALLVVLHVFNGFLLYGLVQELWRRRGLSTASFLAFCILPTGTIAIGWVGTIADLLSMCFMLCALLLWSLRPRVAGAGRLGLASFYALFAIVCMAGLMSKEHFIVVPAVLLTLSLLIVGRRALDLVVISGLLCMAYLALRWGPLFSAPTRSYSTSPANAPANGIVYFLYPFVWGSHESHVLLATTPALLLGLAAVMHAVLIALLFMRGGWRAGVGYLVLFAVSIAPVLPISGSFGHYLYMSTPVFAVAFGGLLASTEVKTVAAAVLLILAPIAHTVNIQRTYWQAGVVQTRVYTSLYSILKSLGPESGIATGRQIVVLESGPFDHVLRRALHDLTALRDLRFQPNQIYSVKDLHGQPADAVVLECLPYGHVVLPAACSWGGARACAPRLPAQRQ
jgi:hypothetical protein